MKKEWWQVHESIEIKEKKEKMKNINYMQIIRSDYLMANKKRLEQLAIYGSIDGNIKNTQ